MSNKTEVKAVGCLGTILTLALSILSFYFSMHLTWGLEVKSWPAFWGITVVSQIVLSLMIHVFARLMED